MRAKAIATGLAAFILACGAARADGPPRPCSLAEFTSLDMRTLPDGEFSVPVSIGGTEFPMVFDTGSLNTSITGETADRLNLERSWAYWGGHFINNVSVDQSVTVSELRIGPLRSDGGWKVLIIPDGMVPATEAGLLGPDFVYDDDVELDFFRGKFNIFKHNNCDGHVVYWTHDAYAALPISADEKRHIGVQAWLDGKAVKVVFDTGSAISTMGLEDARQLLGLADNDPRIKQTGSEGINGGDLAMLYSFPFGTLSFDGIAVTNPQITLIPKKNYMQGRNHDATIVLGMSVIRQLHLYIDYQGQMLYLTAAEAH
jgi:predicted aspartyl protease